MSTVTPLTSPEAAESTTGHEPSAEEFAAAARKHAERAESLRQQADEAPHFLGETYRRRAAELELAAFVQQVRAEAKGFPASETSAA